MNSTQGAQQKIQVQNQEEPTPESAKHDDKRKADTDCQNPAFMQSLRQRLTQPSKSFAVENIRTLRSMSSGRPPKERLNIPEGVDVFQYGN